MRRAALFLALLSAGCEDASVDCYQFSPETAWREQANSESTCADRHVGGNSWRDVTRGPCFPTAEEARVFVLKIGGQVCGGAKR